MKIIISESQVNLLKESSIIDMDTQELYNRSLKLKNSEKTKSIIEKGIKPK